VTKVSTSFIGSVSILFTGTVFAQLIGYLASPIISRQFSPDEAAYLGLFLRVTTLGAAIATARLEMALPIEKEDRHAFGIYRYSMRFSVMISVLALGLLFIYAGIEFASLDQFFFLLSLPIGIFFTAFYNQGVSWSLRKEHYSLISRTSLLLSVLINGFKMFFGIFGGHFLGLICGTLLGYFFSLGAFLREYLSDRKNFDLTAKSKRTKLLVVKHSDLYKYNLPHVFIDLARDLLLASLIWSFYGKFEFGSYDHAYRMLRLPVVFIGAAIGQVLFRKCTTLLQEDKAIFPLVMKVTLVLGGLSVVPFFLINIYGPDLFTFVFGAKWKESGEMATIMIPWLLLNFITSPISHLPILLGKQKSFFWLNVIGTASMLLVVALPYAGMTAIGFKEMLLLLSLSQSCFLLVVLIWLLYIAKKQVLRKIG
jgi:teichuronic acid exporter